MKNTMMISLVAGIGLVVGPLSASASDFGSGWTRDNNSGTLVNSNAPTVEQQQTTSSTYDKRNSFGGGWAHNSSSGTIYNSNAPTVEKSHSSASKGKSHSSDRVWAKNYMFGTS